MLKIVSFVFVVFALPMGCSPIGGRAEKARASSAVLTQAKHFVKVSSAWDPDGISVSACAIDASGLLQCWGKGEKETRGSYRDVSVGVHLRCAVKATGELDCMLPGQKVREYVFEGHFKEVQVSGRRMCALTTKSDIICWSALVEHAKLKYATDTEATHLIKGPFKKFSLDGLTVCGLDERIKCFSSRGRGPVNISSKDQPKLRAMWHLNAKTPIDSQPDHGESNFSPPEKEPCVILKGAVLCEGELDLFSPSHEQSARFEKKGSVTFAKVVSSTNYNCGLKLDGEILCWGAVKTSPLTGKFKDVSVGDRICGVSTKGKIICVSPYSKQEVFSDREYAQIATSGGAVCGLSVEGNVRCYADVTEKDYDYSDGIRPEFPLKKIRSLHSSSSAHICDGCNVPTCGVSVDNIIQCIGGNTAPFSGKSISDFFQGSQNCKIDLDGKLECTPRVYYSPNMTPVPTILVSDVGIGDFHSCAVKKDQMIECWGLNSSGQRRPPAGKFTSISSGKEHSCALSVDQKVVCWGNNDEGQSSPP